VFYSYVEVTSCATLKGASNMNIQFETSQIGQTEAQGLILLLSSLFPTATAGLVPNGLTLQPPPPPPKNEEEAIFGVPIQAEPAAPTAAHAQPEPTSESPKRTRRTKAEMEATANAKPQAAPADPTPVSAVQTAEASVTTQSATASKSTVSADDLRGLLNGYIAKHSMEEAIGRLKAFGCNRVTEALALAPGALNALAEALRG
jgi:hypothetical protein